MRAGQEMDAESVLTSEGNMDKSMTMRQHAKSAEESGWRIANRTMRVVCKNERTSGWMADGDVVVHSAGTIRV